MNLVYYATSETYKERIDSDAIYDLIRHDYLPTCEGSLIQVIPEELGNLNPNGFLWEDYKAVRQILVNHKDLVYVATYQLEGNILYDSKK